MSFAVLAGEPLVRLFEQPGLLAFRLPPTLSAHYGGELGIATPRLFANFVTAVDGVVALGGAEESGHLISKDSSADRFVMGLLRACADAVMLGAGTFRKAPGQLWRAAQIYPAGATLFAELRAELGLSPHPKLVLVTASGDLDTSQPAVDDAIIVTTAAGAASLQKRLPASTRLLVQGSGQPGPLALAPAVERLRAEGLRRILTEGGPSLVGQLVAQGLLDELFLTLSPALFGRFAADGRKSLLDGVALDGALLELLSVHRSGSQLFLRYSTR